MLSISLTYTQLLKSKKVLWAIFWTNLLGTGYGFIWYGHQLQYTLLHKPWWQVPFVADSPTASLFFTLSIGMLLIPPQLPIWKNQSVKNIKLFIEAFAVVTSVKYGIWAVSMIIVSRLLGNPIVWEDWLLIVSHAGMAAEALLFVPFFCFRFIHFFWVAIWLFSNDFVDYQYNVYPWLPTVLLPYLFSIAIFTITLTFVSLVWSYKRSVKCSLKRGIK